MTNKELAAQCLIEAANILNDKEEVIEESYGNHGVMGKALEEKLKNIPKDTEKRYNQYVKAGYEDKIPEKLKDDYYSKKSLENGIKNDYTLRHSKSKAGLSYARDNTYNKGNVLNTREASDIGREIELKHIKNANATSTVNKRINKRAGMKESIDYMFDDIDFSDILD